MGNYFSFARIKYAIRGLATFPQGDNLSPVKILQWPRQKTKRSFGWAFTALQSGLSVLTSPTPSASVRKGEYLAVFVDGIVEAASAYQATPGWRVGDGGGGVIG